MSRKKIALILPIKFAVRGFLETDILSQLHQQADLLLLSPFSNSLEFVERYSEAGIEHALLQDFLPKGKHNTWYRRYNEVQRRYQRLYALQNKAEISQYYSKLQKTAYSKNMRLKIFLRKRALPSIAANRIGVQWLQKLEHSFYIQARYEEHSYYSALLTHYAPDLVVSASPNRYQEIPIARAVEELKIPHIAYVLSFDNIVCYPDFPRIYDKYMVWNDRNKRELRAQYSELGEDRIVVCGPLQFDFYAKKHEYLMPREAWLAKNNISQNGPVILYAETGPSVAPHEPEIVADLSRRLSLLHFDQKPTLLVRTHPMHFDTRWKQVQENYPEVRFQALSQSHQANSIIAGPDHMEWDRQDIADLINTLQYADVHLNIASTMSLDAAYFDRPSIGIAYDPRPGSPFGSICRSIYKREHLVGFIQSGGVALAYTPEEAISHIRRYLADPSQDQNARSRMVQAYDPFRDGKAAERVANVILSCIK